MNTSWLILLLSGIWLLSAQGPTAAATVSGSSGGTSDTAYAVVDRGPDYAVLQKTTVENGTNRIHKITTLATGMHYTNSLGQWIESKEQISILPQGGAAATQGRHKVYFPADIYNGVMEVVTSDGRHLRSRPLGVNYDDSSNTVWIAQLKPSIGWLTASNQVTYRDAFTGIKADLVCTYRRGGFECDLVFREQPPTPDQCGLDASFSTLQLVTEFFNTADPQQIPAASDEWYGLQDNTLKFGKLTMTYGKVFAFKSANPALSAINPATPVYKTWTHVDGRTFLIETVPLLDIADDLDALPLTASTTPPTSEAKSRPLLASRHRVFPSAHECVTDTNQIQLAIADTKKEPGVVLDYNTVDSDQTGFTFQSGLTYYVSSELNLSGTNTFEAGTVIKLTGGGLIDIDADGSIVCPPDPSEPAVFTSINDDTVGEIIDGSSGSPSFGDVYIFLNVNCPNLVLRNLRFKHGYYCVYDYNYYMDKSLEVWDCQFLDVAIAIEANNCNVGLRNVLVNEADSDYAFYVEDTGDLVAENVTVESLGLASCYGSIFKTNCLITLKPMDGHQWVSVDGGAWTNYPLPVFQTGANGNNYYLAADSPYRDVGTTNINPDLLAELQTMTTYAPQDGGWPDTNQLDIGYHYPVNEDSDCDGLPDWWELKYFSHLGVNPNDDPDGDGMSNFQEFQDGTDPLNADSVRGLLGRWHFDDTNWLGAQGQAPLVATNLQLVPSWSSNAVELDGPDADLRYRLVEDDGHTNLNQQCGTMRFWFCPNWSSIDQGGTGPGNWSCLVEVYPNPAGWSLWFEPDGTTLEFLASADGSFASRLDATVSVRSNLWHQVAVTYCPTNTTLYLDGLPVASGSDIPTIPDWDQFLIGNDGYGNMAMGRFDELDTFDYPLSAGRIAADYFTSGHGSNVISFSFSVPNQYVTNNMVNGVITVLDGLPSFIAKLVDDTNFAGANWTAYTSSNIMVNIGASHGVHDVWIGLRGRLTNSYPTWQETTLILNSNPPAIAITSPVDNAAFNASRVNVSGSFTAATLKQITVNGILAFVNGSNFEARNVPLAGGANLITADIEDLTGMTNAASITVMGITNTDGSLNDPVQLQATPVAGFTPLPVTFSVQANTPGSIQQVLYDFNGDDITDLTAGNLDALTHTYETNGEYFPVVTIQTDAGRFSSIGGWNAVIGNSSNQPVRINVQAPAAIISTFNITDPMDLKWDGAHLYVLSGSGGAIYELATNGDIIRWANNIGSTPSGLDVDGAGNVYVAVKGNNQVWKFNPTDTSFQADTNFGIGGCIGLTNGATGTGNGEFSAPFDVAVSPDGGTISVSDSTNNRIQQLSAASGVFISAFGSPGIGIGQFNTPKGLTYDAYGTLYIVDSGNSRIVLAQGSAVMDVTGSGGNELGQFTGPLNVSIGKRGVYVADTGNSRIQKFDLPAQGLFEITTFGIGYAISDGLDHPAAVAAVDNLTNELFYVADTGNNQVLLCQLPDSNADEILAVWNGMTNCVAKGEIASAARFFCSKTSDGYQQAFFCIGLNKSISDIKDIGTLSPVYIRNNLAQYYFEQTVNRATLLFPIQFVKENGMWKIFEF